jgi:soluble lytic murein transglycosylase
MKCVRSQGGRSKPALKHAGLLLWVVALGLLFLAAQPRASAQDDASDQLEASADADRCEGEVCEGGIDLEPPDFDPADLELADPNEAGPYPVLDLQPYFGADHPWHEAQARLGRGDCAGAVELVRPALDACGAACPGRDALRFLEARALVCAERPQEALEVLGGLDTEGYPGMEAEVRVELRRLQLSLGVPAAPPLEPSLERGAEEYLQGQLDLARAEAQTKKLDRALQRLQRVQAEVVDPSQARRAAVEEGELLEDAGRLEEAAKVFYRVWRRSPGSATGAAMVQKLDELQRRGVPCGLTEDEHFDAVMPLLERGEKASIKTAIQRHARRYGLAPQDWKAVDRLARALAFEKDRKRDKALKEIKLAERGVKSPALKARIWLTKALILRRLHKDDEAITLYEQVAALRPDDRIAPEAQWQAARLHLYEKRYEKARDLMRDLVVNHPDDERVPDALWQAAWAEWLRGDMDASIRLLDALRDKHGQRHDPHGTPYEAKAVYWKSRALGVQGHKPEALDGLLYMIDRFPLTYYAAQSYAWIKELGGTAPPFHGGLEHPVDMQALRRLDLLQVPASPRARRGLELWKTGRKDEAKAELLAQLHYKHAPRGVVEILASLHLHDGSVSRSHWVADRYGSFQVAPYEGNQRLWGLAYPAPEDLLGPLQDIGQELDFSPLLSLAIIRHESAFHPGAQSQVGAVGLMQVMPGTAKTLRALAPSAASATQLWKPEHNLRLGSTLLKLLEQHYDGNLPLMIGAYNAGVGVGDRWWRDFHDLDTDALVEQMTYPLTVTYLKKVIGSYYAYRVLYGDGAAPEIPVRPPATIPSWGQPLRPPAPALSTLENLP